MDIGIAMFVTQSSIDVAELAQACEGHGFESLWVPEHPAIPAGPKTPWPGSPDGVIPQMYYECVDPFVALGRASSVTSTLKLGTGICLVPERNPILLAKEIATLDYYSGGRFLFGIGTGWLREETELFGVDFGQRIGYTRESILGDERAVDPGGWRVSREAHRLSRRFTRPRSRSRNPTRRS